MLKIVRTWEPRDNLSNGIRKQLKGNVFPKWMSQLSSFRGPLPQSHNLRNSKWQITKLPLNYSNKNKELNSATHLKALPEELPSILLTRISCRQLVPPQGKMVQSTITTDNILSLSSSHTTKALDNRVNHKPEVLSARRRPVLSWDTKIIIAWISKSFSESTWIRYKAQEDHKLSVNKFQSPHINQVWRIGNMWVSANTTSP